MAHLGRILFVEDHPDVREALAALLQEFGYEVEPVESAEAGLERLLASRFDLVVTDYSLPGHTGAWLIREAERRGLIEAAQAMVVTALPQPEGCEGVTVLRKPLDISVFLDHVASHLSRKAEEAADEARRETDARGAVDLTLYVTTQSQRSHQALKALEQLLRGFAPESYRLTVHDLAREGHAEAEQDKVTFTPTLVKRAPNPRAWVVGGFQDTQKLEGLMELWGMQPRRR